MAIQKKHGKGRLDKWYRLAKEKGYRARAAFKLIQLNRKYGFLEKSKVLLDLCAAPGSWCQVAAETMPTGSLIIGVDLAPIKPIPRTITFQSDITTDKCRATIRSHLKTWKADTVLHDGAPNVGVAWVQDAYSQADLVLESLKLAVEFLTPGGNFVTKLFRSKDYNALIWIFNQLFERVEATKPPSSRSVSAEIFVVCRGFKAPKKIDPRLLDARSVFAELATPKENHEAKVYNPEKKTRKRQGYEEGDYTQFKELPASSFITAADPIELLSTINKFHFGDAGSEAENVTQEVLKKLKETTEEIKACSQDLKVLSRRDFKALLRWRLRARDILGISKPKGDADEQEEHAEVVPLDEEMQMQQDLQAMERAVTTRRKKERRRENERKRKEIIRLQMHMQTPTDIGIESAGAPIGESTFSLKTADTADAVGHLGKGRMPALATRERTPTPELDSSSDEEGDRLEAELDELYEHYQQEKADANNKFRAKRARKAHEKDEWDGFGSDEEKSSENEQNGSESSSDSDSDPEDNGTYKTFHTQGVAIDGDNPLSRDAQIFFSQDLFKGIAGLEVDGDKDSGIDMDDSSPPLSKPKKGEALPAGKLAKKTQRPVQMMEMQVTERDQTSENDGSESEEDDSDAADGAVTHEEEEEEQTDAFAEETNRRDEGPQDIEIITAEAMELARQLASGQKKKSDLIDDGFNKLAFRDREGLPDWFLDDENQHSKPLKPISAAAAAAIKEKLRLLNARPIKKVQEARARKKFRATRRLEKLRKKSALLADDEGMSEKDKAASIMKMMHRAVKKQPRRKTQVVVARGVNRGIAGRPRGVKGRYKVVDARLKKDARALKRLEKKKKK